MALVCMYEHVLCTCNIRGLPITYSHHLERQQQDPQQLDTPIFADYYYYY